VGGLALIGPPKGDLGYFKVSGGGELVCGGVRVCNTYT